MKSIRMMLQINHWLFAWYYKRVNEHFHQWTFFKSVKMLVSNYNHDQLLLSNAYKHNRDLIHELDLVRKELHNIRMQQIATPGQIDTLNKIFGMDYDNPTDN